MMQCKKPQLDAAVSRVGQPVWAGGAAFEFGVFPSFIEISAQSTPSWHAPCLVPLATAAALPTMTHPSRQNHLHTGADEPLAVDTSRRFVRVTERRADGLVAFEFAIDRKSVV